MRRTLAPTARSAAGPERSSGPAAPQAHGASSRGQHQRHSLLVELAKDAERHLVLATATPHSGIEAAFRSLLGLLNPALTDLPEDLSGPANEEHRRRVAVH